MATSCRHLHPFLWTSLRGGCAHGAVAWSVRDAGGRLSSLPGHSGSLLPSRLARGLLTHGDACSVQEPGLGPRPTRALRAPELSSEPPLSTRPTVAVSLWTRRRATRPSRSRVPRFRVTWSVLRVPCLGRSRVPLSAGRATEAPWGRRRALGWPRGPFAAPVAWGCARTVPLGKGQEDLVGFGARHRRLLNGASAAMPAPTARVATSPRCGWSQHVWPGHLGGSEQMLLGRVGLPPSRKELQSPAPRALWAVPVPGLRATPAGLSDPVCGVSRQVKDTLLGGLGCAGAPGEDPRGSNPFRNRRRDSIQGGAGD